MKYTLEFKDLQGLVLQIRENFFNALQKTVEEELDHRAYRKYFDRFYQSEFYKDFDTRIDQVANQIYDLNQTDSSANTQEIEQLLDQMIYSFINHFIIVHCSELHKMKLPQAMLRYQETKIETSDLPQMIADFLDFENEPEKVYTDFLNMSKSKLKNAGQAFLKSAPSEKIFFICDQTVFGSCNEGFSMTEKALYWKSHFNPPGKVDYNAIKEIKRESEWMTINGQFFNVSRSMNYKMMKLLQKIRESVNQGNGKV